MSLPLLAGDYASQLWQSPPYGVSQAVSYGPGGVIFGSEETNKVVWVDTGDYVKLAQTGDYGGANLVRVRGSFRANASQPGPWRALVRSSSVTEYNEDWSGHYSRGWEQRFDDLALNVTTQTGSRVLEVGLYYTGTSGYQVLPTVCFSTVQLETATTEVALINRFPSPNAVRVPLDLSTWRLDIADFTGNGIDTARTVIHVNGFKVYDGGDVGSYTSSTSLVGPGSQTRRFTLDVDASLPAYNLYSERVCQVSVATYTVGGTVLYEEDYSFTLDDVLAPNIRLVESTTTKVVRVTWDDDMRADGSLYAADTLDNYSLTPLTFPAYTPQIRSIVAESSTSYLLYLDQELTFGASYELLASSYVEDSVGNRVNIDGRAYTFSAPVPESTVGRDMRLVERVPAYNLDRSPVDLRNFLESLQDSVDVLSVQIDRWSDILEPDIAPEMFLDAMLSDLGCPFTWDDVSVDRKRRWVLELIRLYSLKGTAIGIVSAIRLFLGVDAAIELPELLSGIWIIGEGVLGEATLAGDEDDPTVYSFNVIVDAYLTDQLRERVLEVVNYFKCPHEHILSLTSTTTNPPVESGYWILGDAENGILGSTTVLYG